MSDQPTKKRQPPSPGFGGNGIPRIKAGSQANERLNDLLLGIVEREIGRAEPRRTEDWDTLRRLAVGHPSGAELVTTLEGVIDRCNQEMTARFGGHGADLTKLRDSVVMLIRVSLAKKLGLGPVKES